MYEYVITCGSGVMLVHAIVDKDTMTVLMKAMDMRVVGDAELGSIAYHPTATEPVRFH
jgi:hypothetical protein